MPSSKGVRFLHRELRGYRLYRLFFILPFLLFIAFLQPTLAKVYTRLFDKEPKEILFLLGFMAPLHTGFLLVCAGVYCFLYWLKSPFFERFKTNDLPWPWESNRAAFFSNLPNCIKRYLINQFVISSFILWCLKPIFPLNGDPNDLPSLPTVFLQIFFSLICEDFLFYWSHRALHSQLLYSRIHKIHHEYPNVFYLSAVNAHWLEYILSNLAPLMLGPFVLGPKMHKVTFYTWTMFRVTESHEVHSGYSFPWSIFQWYPLSTDSAYHNFHHVKTNQNFATFFFFWDSVFGTNRDYVAEVLDSNTK